MCITYFEIDEKTGKKRFKVIGDGERENEVISPLSTIKQAIEDALKDNLNHNPINIKIGGN